MPWKNSWFQLAALVAVITGGLLIYDFGPTAYSSLMAAKSVPSAPTPTTPPAVPPSVPPASSPPQPVAKDNAEAVGYRIKATAGDVESARKLKILYFNGHGVPRDYAEAFKWFQKAADQGDSVSQMQMDSMYLNGQGVTRDVSKALASFQKAADQNNPVAQVVLGQMYEGYLTGMLDGLLTKDYSKALAWFQKAADQGNPEAQFWMGNMYERGEGVTKDYSQALSWYQKAADQGDTEAQTVIGYMYAVGEGVTKDDSKALASFQKAADEGDSQAQSQLGYMYENGKGVTKDIPTALDWYKKAAAMGNHEALDALKRLESPSPISPPTTSAQPASTPPPSTPAPVIPAPVAPAPPAVGPVAGQEWYNSLGMKFVPAGTDGVLFCTWDVRVKDFQAYVQATGAQQPGGIFAMKVKTNANGSHSITWELDPNASWEHPGFEQGPTHPVVGVSWNDAIAFCEWLTKKERGEGKLGPKQMYRLPMDAEWSTAVGDGKYPWGEVWPPPNDAGNYGDQALAASLPGTRWNSVCLPENDGYPRTSPVGSFHANAYGLYDMGGNVWQWCMDWYQASMNSDEVRQKIPALSNDGGGTTYKVLRGASWSDNAPVRLLSSFRSTDVPGNRFDDGGFRVVVVVSP